MLIVEPGYPLDPGPKALLEQSHTLMTTLFEPEENYFLGFEALCTPDVHFFIAREGDTVLGTGAVVDKESYGEVKSMFTANAARGKGVGAALLRALEDHARTLKLPVLKLETALRLPEAVRLYARHGFTECGRFGDYRPNDTSYFMEKPLV
ncbi:GNAT family N-acetyltransferase [Roseovarius sp. LXJ103]|uniref:GNAT family N-acetyltransferase n=1 Tax=Roseovarius carneus TaxID=2853164 RepID=UPI000D60DB64|nr:GNAT family N-acetyltransferase [Roseovarius carneus]MBZ8117319.1 GNAT family N-acetyltransferase [Roseovarius carneus]PWE36857.1 GNAT family N-acetyltransferase [Pelagicola sp. LXJ1103]